MKLSRVQQEQLEDKGISLARLQQQLRWFREGFPIVKLARAATVGDGIKVLDQQEQHTFISRFLNQKDSLEIIKFVPASGAATRMFKFLHEFLSNFNVNNESINSYINRNKAQELFTFFTALEKFPFYKALVQDLKEEVDDWSQMTQSEKQYLFVQKMMEKNGYNYAVMPKGLVPFHRYKNHVTTAFAEHLFEASLYANCLETSKLHFTIAPDFEPHFREEVDRVVPKIEEKTGVRFQIDFSYQRSHTDTVAVNKRDEPILQEDGAFLFRPAGHGALLDNLNDLEADLIFIKNIDNVTVSAFEKKVCHYKKMLGGLALHLRDQCFEYLDLLQSAELSLKQKSRVEQFITTELGYSLPTDYQKFSDNYQIESLINRLDRPLRVCGMVKNEGEPGGGPFWVRGKDGSLTLEIVESAQVDHKNKRQQQIAESGTHFNPVDIVCSVKNNHGNKYDLHKFCEPDAGFITYKSKNGIDLKAQELPGLWNGGMSQWNTVFVEVPLFTFNPVKTVNDLLKPAHQLNGH
ncbi:MAG: DUF4301 family protein [Nonlabens sp.]